MKLFFERTHVLLQLCKMRARRIRYYTFDKGWSMREELQNDCILFAS